MKICLIFLFSISSLLAAQDWSTFKPASHDFSKPHYYAAKDTILNWYTDLFFSRFDSLDQELIKYAEKNHLTSGPFLCEKITMDALTANMCDPWAIAIFINENGFYAIHKRTSFFKTSNYMQILKMNLNLDKYHTFFLIQIPYSSKFEYLDNNSKLALSFYYFYDYQMHDNCFDYECQDKTRIKRKLTLNYDEENNYLSFSWIHRALFYGCAYNSAPFPCITAREVTYIVQRDRPTIWRNQLSLEQSIGKAWPENDIWDLLEQFWITGEKSFEEVYRPSSN